MDLSELISSVDIVDYISQYVELKENGDEYWGISPFTYPPERTPSFSVRRANNSFYDFSSGIGGNIFTFIRYYNHVSKPEAVKILQKYAGIEGEIDTPREKMAATLVCKRYARPKTQEKQSKVEILPDDYMLRYEKDAEKLAVWEKEGISSASLDKFQVFYDKFANRLVYPIRSPEGKIVNVGGRTLDPMWKEKKLRKYMYYQSWGTINTIYGLAENMEYIKKQHEIILFEGCKSVLLADTWGIHNCGAILTSHLSQNQMKILARLGCRVVFALDKEINVYDDHHIQKLSHYVNVEFIFDKDNLLDAKDAPVDKGKEVFKELYDRRKRY